MVAQTSLIVEQSDQIATQNLLSAVGLPISREAGNPPGSNGKGATGNESTGIYKPPTPGQFRSYLSAGSVGGLGMSQWQALRAAGALGANTTPYRGSLARQMGLGVATNDSGEVTLTLRRVSIGRMLAPRRPTHLFGQHIKVPLLTEGGTTLTSSDSTAYWLDKPYLTGDESFYWSPHARKVYASQTGPLFVTWMRATPFTPETLPAYTNLLGSRSFVTNGANIFLLYTEAYMISATPAQPARKMYWTQKEYMPTGKPVLVPSARVSGIRVAYSPSFPRTVPTEYKTEGTTSPTDGSTNAVLQELRTLWFEQQAGAIFAYNAEGRVLVEVLGDARNDGTYIQMGTEIVEVRQFPVVTDVTVELGERLVPPAAEEVSTLYAEPVRGVTGDAYLFQDSSGTRNRIAFYATRETKNLNDVLVHWMEDGMAGLRWPKYYSRYALVWPSDVARYSIYVRPTASGFEQAQATSVQLDALNAPVIEYQDPYDQPRARFTSDLRFYTHLDPGQDLHRTLLRYTSNDKIAFERVLSVRVEDLRAGTLGVSSVAQSFSAWNGTTMVWPDELTAPRVVTGLVSVGERIAAPAGEEGSGLTDDYVAGYLNTEVGNLYHPGAYLDPFVSGFEAANQGAIIPVNAVPGRNALEVWWFRKSNANAGMNVGNTEAGFTPSRWPSAVGRYTIAWPLTPREIVLASRLGGLDARVEEAGGVIYSQNDPSLAGYNPNEEHAIMSAGVPYATRDDLNLTGPTAATYSSDPHVLVSYPALDGRPAMAVYKVLREKPSEGYVFDYLVPAGQIVQPPPPLGFLAAPVVGSGDAARSLNYEPDTGSQDLPSKWNAAMGTGAFGHYRKFTYEDRHHDLWVFRGPHSGLPALQAGWYHEASGEMRPLGTVTVLGSKDFTIPIHATRQSEFLALTIKSGPPWVATTGMNLTGTAPSATGSFTVVFTVTDVYEGSAVDGTLTVAVSDSGVPSALPGGLALKSTNPYTGTVVTFTNRAPFLGRSPTPANSFTVRYYYRTEESFAWPGLANPPKAGSIVPYLRPRLPDGTHVGDPASSSTTPVDIVYRPYWPERDPKDASKAVGLLPYGATLAGSVNGLPAVRDFRTAHVLYQQSIAADMTAADPAVVLHDPTRAKYADIKKAFPSTGTLPSSIAKELYQGRYFFPTLPPHLQTRIYVDPNRGEKGSLVLVGEYRKEALGASYLLLNALSRSDIMALKDICPGADAKGRAGWNALVDALETVVETFVENPQRPGTYKVDERLTNTVDVSSLANIGSPNIAVDSYAISATGPGSGYVTLIESSGTAFTQPGDPVSMHVFRVGGILDRGEMKVLPSANPLSELVTFQFSGDLAARDDQYEFQWKIAAPVDGQPPVPDATMSRYLTLRPVTQGLPRVMIGGAGVQALGDNYVVMRYRPVNNKHPLYKAQPTDADWSQWTAPVLAEGWIKRVLAGINPFNQRVKDLFNNQVNSDVSLLTQAGRRWEGDVALNIDSISNYGLIEVYETVLRRGRMLSIEAGFNYGPANDALLLAAGYLNDLYMLLGNEAWADAANPTIGIGTADRNYGDISTALFAFKGQVASLIDEELGLLRGRDDFLMPGVDIPPVYNRMFWNYTRGIDAGEVIYALNYNIKEKVDGTPDGVIGAEDAAYMFPQGHGDAYGHYLTALKGYYSLLVNPNFDWVPRVEAVSVLGKAVTVDYQDERKFAAAAAALARSGRQIFDLTWRKDYLAVHASGWAHLSATRSNPSRTYVNQETGATETTVRRWGTDHWASRVGQGTYVNWLAANAVLPAVDPDPTHEGIQRVDRTTVTELDELVMLATGLNTAVDNCEGGLSPLGVSEGGIAFDLDPNAVVGGEDGTHFEQVYVRAKRALANAVTAFDDAKDVTRLMRGEADSLAELQANIAQQEAAYTASLIEVYGTPYPDDVGAGKMYKQGYEGPDIVHYAYVDLPEFDFPDLADYTARTQFEIKIPDADPNWMKSKFTNFNYIQVAVTNKENYGVQTEDGRDRNGIVFETANNRTNFVFSVDIGSHGYAEKPAGWTGRRRSPGKVQQAISRQIMAHAKLREELLLLESDTDGLQESIALFRALNASYDSIRAKQEKLFKSAQVLAKVKFANDLFQAVQDAIKAQVELFSNAVTEAVPKSLIAGVAAGGDMTSPARGALKVTATTALSVLNKVAIAREATVLALELAQNTQEATVQFKEIEPEERNMDLAVTVKGLVDGLTAIHKRYWVINERVRELDDAHRAIATLVAEGDRIQAEREVFRRRMASVVQGYRTRDAGFRFFRNEKLERYKTLQDLATRYALLAANAYDYETGLLGTTAGRQFVQGIVASRALGVVRNGEPQFAGSSTGDPGLSSALASMKADWDVLKGRLGFNNPDAYGTTVSLRTENFRILPTTDGDLNWRDVMNRSYRADLLSDADVVRSCLQMDDGSGLPVPGFVFTFSTEIAKGKNLFGQPLAAGDSYFSPASFATKIFASGVALEGYRGMASPSSNGGVVGTGGATSPTDPGSWFLDPLALSATPYVYLIPVGVDRMRSPPLGDQGTVREWSVDDVAVPMPFNIGASEFATKKLWQSADSLSESLFEIRKHQPFRAVPSASNFSPSLYAGGGRLQRSQFTNNRLVGRSIWNTQWKLVIPAHALLANPDEGVDRFMQTLKDIKLHFVTYSYSGN